MLDNTQYIEYNIIKKGGKKLKDGSQTEELINLTISLVNLATSIIALETVRQSKKSSSKKKNPRKRKSKK